MWDSLITLMKAYPRATLTVVVGVFLAGSAFTGWITHAELCHQKAEIAVEGVAELKRIHEDSILEKQAVNRTIAEMCDSGELDESAKPVTCAKARAAVEANR